MLALRGQSDKSQQLECQTPKLGDYEYAEGGSVDSGSDDHFLKGVQMPGGW